MGVPEEERRCGEEGRQADQTEPALLCLLTVNLLEMLFESFLE